LEFLGPQPDEVALAAVYGSHYYEAWGVSSNEPMVRMLKVATFRQRLAAILPLLPSRARVLDVGCATGYFLEAAREEGLEPYGVEISEFGAEESRARIGAGRVFQGELEYAHFDGMPDQGFDAVFMSDLIEHVRDPRSTLNAARRQLKERGLLVVTTPWTASLSRRFAGRRWLHYKPEHLYYFGPKNLSMLLGQCGFSVESTHVAMKCLTLGYAATQLAAGAAGARRLCRLLSFLPRGILARPLWLGIGEVTLVASVSRAALRA
jgi:SAM-dependent methyltransferase